MDYNLRFIRIDELGNVASKMLRIEISQILHRKERIRHKKKDPDQNRKLNLDLQLFVPAFSTIQQHRQTDDHRHLCSRTHLMVSSLGY